MNVRKRISWSAPFGSGFEDVEGHAGTYRARIGRGGGRVSLSSIVGSVRSRRH